MVLSNDRAGSGRSTASSSGVDHATCSHRRPRRRMAFARAGGVSTRSNTKASRATTRAAPPIAQSAADGIPSNTRRAHDSRNPTPIATADSPPGSPHGEDVRISRSSWGDTARAARGHATASPPNSNDRRGSPPESCSRSASTFAISKPPDNSRTVSAPAAVSQPASTRRCHTVVAPAASTAWCAAIDASTSRP